MARPVRPLPPPPVAGQNCAHGAHPSNGWRWFSALGRWERICYTHSGRGAAMKRGDYVLDPSHRRQAGPVSKPTTGNLDQQEAEDSGTHSPPAVLNVHKAALQEIDRVVGNELTLDESETSRLRGILFAALSEEHTRG